MNAQNPITERRFCTGQGQNDTHAETLSDGRHNPHASAGHPYKTITARGIAAMVIEPPSVEKKQAQWFLPSTYAGSDARSHDAQRKLGAFWWLVLDLDDNNPGLQDVLSTLDATLGGCSKLIYSSRSATPDRQKWRALIPLKRPIAGVDYSDTAAAFYDLLENASGGLLIPDRKLQGPGQLVYLPNRGAHFDHHIHRTAPLDLPPDHPIIRWREQRRAARARAEREAKAARERRMAERQSHAGHDDVSPVDHFNAANAVDDLLDRYGYRRAGDSNDWRSPMQTSGSYATRSYGDWWVSLSGSDAAAEIGAATKTGNRHGDAFDLFCYFVHGGDFNAAVAGYGAEIGGAIPDRQNLAASDASHPEHVSGPEMEAGHTEWRDPDPRFLRDDLPPPPDLPLADVLGPLWSRWVEQAADAKASPPDYVVASLLAVAGSLIGNTRWASPWPGWVEPPVIWAMVIGAPSANKSPGLDALLSPLKQAERRLRQEAEASLTAWRDKAEVAKLAESAWKEAAKAALKDDKDPPEKPDAANPGVEPALPRLSISDATVERLAVILSKQPRGTLLARDELAGWLHGMTRYSGGGSDRPFWLEAYGGRGYSVERMGRDPVTVDRLTIGVVGGIQPDRLRSLLMKSDDDGLLARFLPVWPNPAPIKRPAGGGDDGFLDRAIARLLELDLVAGPDGEPRPWIVPFAEDSRDLLDAFRQTVRDWEGGAEGLLLSFTGKLQGLAVRLSLVLAYLDWAVDGGAEPREITVQHFGRAAHLVEAYVLPMARRAYAGASMPKTDRAARRLVALIREQRWERFTTREVLRLDRSGLGTVADLNPAIAALEEGDCIRPVAVPPKPKGGRPERLFSVNPAVLDAPS